jgi:CheY-like chemotaxis protein
MNRSNGTRVLVVDDDHATQGLAGAFLERQGYEVRLASNGAVGLEQAITFRPEVVLFDFWMPVADGRALVQGIREVVRTRVGLACMSATPEVEDWCTRVGVSAFVRKPFTATVLCDAVGRALDDARTSSMRIRAAEGPTPSSRPTRVERAERAVLLVGRGVRPRGVRAQLRDATPPVQVAAVESAGDAVRALASISVDAIAVCGDGPATDDPDLDELIAESAILKLPLLLADGARALTAGAATAQIVDDPSAIAERVRALLVPR